MKNREKRYRGITQAAFGCLFLYLNVTINQLNLMPAFVGYFLFLLAIQNLGEENRDFTLLMPLGVLLTGWHLADWLLSLFGMSLDGKVPILHTLATVVNLYFCFQLYTDFAELARLYQKPEMHLDQKICWSRTVLTVTSTVMALPFPWNTVKGWLQIGFVVVLVAVLLAALRLVIQLFALRRIFHSQIQRKE